MWKEKINVVIENMKFRKKNDKNIDNFKKIKIGEKFDLEPGESAGIDITFPVENKEFIVNYSDKYGNLYETRAIIKNGKVKNNTRTILYAPFRTRVRITVVTALIVVLFSYILTRSFLAIASGLIVYTILTGWLEIYYYRVNKRYKERIEIVKRV